MRGGELREAITAVQPFTPGHARAVLTGLLTLADLKARNAHGWRYHGAVAARRRAYCSQGGGVINGVVPVLNSIGIKDFS